MILCFGNFCQHCKAQIVKGNGHTFQTNSPHNRAIDPHEPPSEKVGERLIKGKLPPRTKILRQTKPKEGEDTNVYEPY